MKERGRNVRSDPSTQGLVRSLLRRQVDLLVVNPVARGGIGLVHRDDLLARVTVLVEGDRAEDRVMLPAASRS